MKTNIKLWTMGLMTAALLGNTACTDLLHESYGQVVSEDYVPKTEEDVSYLVNAAYIPWRETLLQWNGWVLCTGIMCGSGCSSRLAMVLDGVDGLYL